MPRHSRSPSTPRLANTSAPPPIDRYAQKRALPYAAPRFASRAADCMGRRGLERWLRGPADPASIRRYKGRERYKLNKPRMCYGANMGNSSGLTLCRAVVVLACGALVVSCSQAPPEPAPEFTLPMSQVSTEPPSPAEPTTSASSPNRLRYVAVPPGQHVAGMAHARILVKHKKAAGHRHRHTQKTAVARPAAVNQPTEAEPSTKP